MNQVDKELLISKRFMNEEEQINVKQIELEAMMESTILLSGKLNDVPSGRLFRADLGFLQMCQSL